MLNAANNAKTTLAQAIDASATSFIVADASAFPDAPFRITVDNEIMEVGTINKATNTFSDVTRGVEDTVATSHDAGASVENRWTAGTYEALVDDIASLSSDLSAVENDLSDVESNFAAHKAEVATLSQLGHVKHSVFTVTLSAVSWSGSSPPFTQTVATTGILATDTPIIDVVMSGDFEIDQMRQEAWSYIYRAVTAHDSITFYANEVPTVELPVKIGVVR